MLVTIKEQAFSEVILAIINFVEETDVRYRIFIHHQPDGRRLLLAEREDSTEYETLGIIPDGVQTTAWSIRELLAEMVIDAAQSTVVTGTGLPKTYGDFEPAALLAILDYETRKENDITPDDQPIVWTDCLQSWTVEEGATDAH